MKQTNKNVKIGNIQELIKEDTNQEIKLQTYSIFREKKYQTLNQAKQAFFLTKCIKNSL